VGYANAPNHADLRHYFDHTSRTAALPESLLDDPPELPEVRFGEYLVEQGVIDRYQLFRALQLQDARPGLRLGEAAVALGFASPGAVERLFGRFRGLATADVG
jgi:hypothetical protein